MTVSVVIPARDEAGGIGQVLSDLARVMRGAGIEYEALVVDDGSSDGTGEIARAGGATVLRNAETLGYGASLKRGIRAARHDLIAITDADGTYPVEEIPALVQMAADYDMAVGVRTGREFYGSAMKRPFRHVFLWLAEYVTGTRIPDVNSGLRLFRRDLALAHWDSLSTGYSFTTTITLLCLLNGGTVGWRPVAYRSRVGHSKVRWIRDTLRGTQILVETILVYNPTKAFLPLVAIPALLAPLPPLLALWKNLPPLALLALPLGGLALMLTGMWFLAVILARTRRPPALVPRPPDR